MAVAPDSRNMDNSAGMELMAATTELTGECWLPSTSGQEMDKEEEDSSQIAYYWVVDFFRNSKSLDNGICISRLQYF